MGYPDATRTVFTHLFTISVLQHVTKMGDIEKVMALFVSTVRLTEIEQFCLSASTHQYAEPVAPWWRRYGCTCRFDDHSVCSKSLLEHSGMQM